MVDLWRYRAGRWLIHLGLRIMPQGRARAELWQMFELWSTKARKLIREHQLAKDPNQ